MAELSELDGISIPLLKLYSSLAGQRPWADFLAAVRDQLNASFATIILTPPTARKPAVVVTPGVPDSAIATAVEFFDLDPFVGLPEGKVVSVNEFIGQEAYQQSPFYQRYVAAYGIDDILGIDLMAKSGFQLRMRICREVCQPGFTAQEQHWLGHFTPHLRAALDLYERFEVQKGEADVFNTAVEQLSVGIVLLDCSGAIVRCNAIARNILNEGDGVTLVNNRLVLAGCANHRRFRDFTRSPDTDRACPSDFMRVERSSGKRALGVVLRRLSLPTAMTLGSSPAIAVFLTDPQQQTGYTGQAIASVLRLTPREAEITACLANGLSISQTAETFGITQNTVRAHLRSVFSKVGINSQSQLVQRVRTSVSGIAMQASPAVGAVAKAGNTRADGSFAPAQAI